MRYGSSYRGASRRVGSILGTAAIVIVLIVLFVVAVYWFRRPKPIPESTTDSIADVLTPTPIVTSIANGLDTVSKEAALKDVSGGGGFGQAVRGTKDRAFYHTVKATLPEINRDAYFYEGWLVRPIPFHFFSTGEMVTNSLGEFVLEWSGEEGKDYSSYTNVVVTLEAKDGNADPDKHIVEGEFGK